MSLVINNNMMAANTARTLNQHYGRLQTSTQRLSSGLRINSAADDAAGLAIRELQRADIAALQQGARNANDAISMIQVADGALGIIDEKLIRMKELAEQAATGTYDSTQRLMIESEYQAMASEITRIANATDFNGTKLLDGTLDGEHDGSGLVSKGEMKIHFGTGNDSAEDYYYIHIGECTSQAFGLGNASTWQDVTDRALSAFEKSLESQIRNDKTLTPEQQGQMLNSIQQNSALLEQALANATDYKQAFQYFTDTEDMEKFWVGNSDLMSRYLAAAAEAAGNAATQAPIVNDQYIIDKLNDAVTAAVADAGGIPTANVATGAWATNGFHTAVSDSVNKVLTDLGIDTATSGALTTALNTPPASADGANHTSTEITAWLGTITTAINGLPLTADDRANAQAFADAEAAAAGGTADTAVLDKFWNELRTTEKQKLQYAWGQAAIDKLASGLKELSDYGVTSVISSSALQDAFTQAGGALTLDAPAPGPNYGPDEQAAAYEKLESFADKLQTQLDKLADSLGLSSDQKQAITDAVDAAKNTLPTIANSDQVAAQAAVDTWFADLQTAIQDAVPAPTTGFTVISSAMADQALQDMKSKVGNMDFAGFTIETQEDAQHALDAINNAIVEKDKIRAHLGATQNRLENTISNLNIQAENLQAAESRISDVDVATEMTQFVRNQILTQSAVAMLGQANSLPQMAMQLIGG